MTALSRAQSSRFKTGIEAYLGTSLGPDRLSSLLRVLVHAITAAIAVWPLSVPSIVFLCFLAGGWGAFFGTLLGRTNLRSLAGSAGLLAVALLGFLIARLVTHIDSISAVLGPVLAAWLGDAALFATGTFAIASLLRFLAMRYRIATALDIAWIGIVLGELLASHRMGAINRPLNLAESFLVRGWDSTAIFVGFGGFAALLILLFLIIEREWRRTLFHGAWVSALVLVAATSVYLGWIIEPTQNDPLGLRGQGETETSAEQAKGQQGPGGQSASAKERPNDDMEFKDDYESNQSPLPMGVVVFHDDYSPPGGIYYLRQGAFSEFNGRRLVQATRRDVDRDLARYFPTSDLTIDDRPASSSFRQEIETTVGLLLDHSRPFAIEAPIRLTSVPNSDPQRFQRMYRVTSEVTSADFDAFIGRDAGSADWSDETWQHYTEQPDDPRYEDLAKRILVEILPERLLDDPMARALAISDWLSKNGIYSLKSKHTSSKDPTANFLFGDRTGYCVHFAHASAFLMRSLGLPARVATGYAVEETARQGGSSLLVTGDRAHAWPEIYLDGVGWLQVDVYPEQSLTPAPNAPDPDLQRLLGEMMRGGDEENGGPPVDEPGDWLAKLLAWLDYARTAAALILVGLILFFLGVKAWRRAAPWLMKPGKRPRLLYRAWLDRLTEIGLRRGYGETREAFARRVEAALPSFKTLTALHLDDYFKTKPHPMEGQAESEDWTALNRALRQDLTANFPAWRRWLGLVIPWSWLQSR